MAETDRESRFAPNELGLPRGQAGGCAVEMKLAGEGEAWRGGGSWSGQGGFMEFTTARAEGQACRMVVFKIGCGIAALAILCPKAPEGWRTPGRWRAFDLPPRFSLGADLSISSKAAAEIDRYGES